jgi:hypothetical protein
MRSAKFWSISTLLLFAAVIFAASNLSAEEDAKPTTVSLADGKLQLQAPGDWVKKQPQSRIIEVEFAVPKAEGDSEDGRLTIMQAGGSVEDNISRWIGQFAQPDGKSTRERAVISEEEVAGQTVHLVDISGNYSDSRGPFAPAVERKDYRMLAAIVVTKDHGQQFVKFYGPRKTVAAHEKAFQTFVKSLKVKS